MTPENRREILWQWLGEVPYPAAMQLMEEMRSRIKTGDMGGMLVFLAHPLMISVGRNADENEIIASAADLKKKGIQIHRSDRGGKITCHGPGQIIGYPIWNLAKLKIGVKSLVDGIEKSIIGALSEMGVDAERDDRRPGVWAGGKKIAAIGMRVKDNITSHGFALNLNFDLNVFNAIVPCGMTGAKSVNLCELTDAPPAYLDAAMAIMKALSYTFRLTFSQTDEENGFGKICGTKGEAA